MQKMKKSYLIAIALLLTVGLTPLSAQTSVDKAADRIAAKAEQMAAQIEQAAEKAEKAAEEMADSIVAYSDTTGVEMADDSAYVTITRGGRNVRVAVPADWVDDDGNFSNSSGSIQVNGVKDFLSVVGDLLGESTEAAEVGVLGAFGIVTVIILLLLLFFVILPLVIVALVLRHVVKNHNNSVRMENDQASRAYDSEPVTSGEEARWESFNQPTGQPLDNNTPIPGKTEAELQWQRGVRNTCIGIGLIAFFYFLDMDGLVGIGILVGILGLGQMFIAKTSK